jgi:hypothetical protein
MVEMSKGFMTEELILHFPPPACLPTDLENPFLYRLLVSIEQLNLPHGLI